MFNPEIVVSQKRKTDFEIPSEGLHAAVIVDVIDLGTVVVNFKGQSKEQEHVRIIWRVDEKDSQGRYKTTLSQLNRSLNEKSKLYAILRGLYGSVPETVVLNKLVGQQAQLLIVHNTVGDRTFANIAQVLKPKAGQAVPTEGYRTKAERDAEKSAMQRNPHSGGVPTAVIPPAFTLESEALDAEFA